MRMHLCFPPFKGETNDWATFCNPLSNEETTTKMAVQMHQIPAIAGRCVSFSGAVFHRVSSIPTAARGSVGLVQVTISGSSRRPALGGVASAGCQPCARGLWQRQDGAGLGDFLCQPKGVPMSTLSFEAPQRGSPNTEFSRAGDVYRGNALRNTAWFPLGSSWAPSRMQTPLLWSG